MARTKRLYPNFPSDLDGEVFHARKAAWMESFRTHSDMVQFYHWLEVAFPHAINKIPAARLEWIRQNSRQSAEAEWSRV